MSNVVENFDYRQASWKARVNSIFVGCPVGDLHGQSEQVHDWLWEQECIWMVARALKEQIRVRCVVDSVAISLEQFETTHPQIELGTN